MALEHFRGGWGGSEEQRGASSQTAEFSKDFVDGREQEEKLRTQEFGRVERRKEAGGGREQGGGGGRGGVGGGVESKSRRKQGRRLKEWKKRRS